MYICICTGKADYAYSADGVFHYCGETTWVKFDPLKNFPMAAEFFYRQCDPVSVGALKSLTVVGAD